MMRAVQDYMNELFWFDPRRAEMIAHKVSWILETDPKVPACLDEEELRMYSNMAISQLKNDDPCLFM